MTQVSSEDDKGQHFAHHIHGNLAKCVPQYALQPTGRVEDKITYMEADEQQGQLSAPTSPICVATYG